ncbi:hypothetical protein Cadr_000028563 [Camelus dromedarius]|uniref:Uncharacterized protein n=1 Tax=Camelus dromedarius TaxID=9838 RepID=A0A5N4CHF8_CAMDR|nr:hypothetical protein Cadr_000028563 [Camelus dromedarius]
MEYIYMFSTEIFNTYMLLQFIRVLTLELAALAGQSGKLLFMRCYRSCDLNDKEPTTKRAKKRQSLKRRQQMEVPQGINELGLFEKEKESCYGWNMLRRETCHVAEESEKAKTT